VIAVGSKQYLVAPGQVLFVERVRQGTPSMLVTPLAVFTDEGRPVLGEGASRFVVECEVIRERKGQKIRGFTYKPKTRQRRRYGHRQVLSEVVVSGKGAIDREAEADLS
jgi:large subunit ribosomal protein L21